MILTGVLLGFNRTYYDTGIFLRVSWGSRSLVGVKMGGIFGGGWFNQGLLAVNRSLVGERWSFKLCNLLTIVRTGIVPGYNQVPIISDTVHNGGCSLQSNNNQSTWSKLLQAEEGNVLSPEIYRRCLGLWRRGGWTDDWSRLSWTLPGFLMQIRFH